MEGSGSGINRSPRLKTSKKVEAAHKTTKETLEEASDYREKIAESYKQRQNMVLHAVDRLFDMRTSIRGLQHNMHDENVANLNRATRAIAFVRYDSYPADRGFFGEAKAYFINTVRELEGKQPATYASAAAARVEAKRDLEPSQQAARRYGRQAERMLGRLARHITMRNAKDATEENPVAPETVVPVAMEVIDGWKALFPDNVGPLRTSKGTNRYTAEKVQYLSSHFAMQLINLMRESARMDAEFISRNGPPIDALMKIVAETQVAGKEVGIAMDTSIRAARERDRASLKSKRKESKSKVVRYTLDVSMTMDDVAVSDYVDTYKEIKSINTQLADLMTGLKQVKEIQKHYLPALDSYTKGEQYFQLADEVVKKVRGAIEHIKEDQRGLADMAHEHEERAISTRKGSRERSVTRLDELRTWMKRQDRALATLRKIESDWTGELKKGLKKQSAAPVRGGR